MRDIDHRRMQNIEQNARVWLSHRPGLFECPSERECKAAMLADFRRGYPCDCHDNLFFASIEVAGFEVRATPTGGFILDWSG